MVCVHCYGDTQVVNSRPQKRNNNIWRRRVCLRCKSIFSTHESADYSSIWRVRAVTGVLEPFSRDKLLLSLFVSLQHRKTALTDAAGLAETAISKLQEHATDAVISYKDIIQVSQVALNRFDKAASTHYQAFHSG
jgi:transcriptional regulator NrdR family protein